MSVSDEQKKRQDKVREYIDQTEENLRVAINNGLFNEGNVQSIKWERDIQGLLSKARFLLKSNQIDVAENLQSTALATINDAISKSSRQWKFVNLYAGPIWLYLCFTLIAVSLFFYFQINGSIETKLNIDSTAVGAVAWGVIGSILRSLWKLKTSVGGLKHRKSFTVYYLSSPILGGILGGIIYLLILGGLVSVSNIDKPINGMPIIVFAALAGFNWEWAVGLFKKVEKLLDAGNTDDKK